MLHCTPLYNKGWGTYINMQNQHNIINLGGNGSDITYGHCGLDIFVQNFLLANSAYFSLLNALY